ncbi:MAG TPA: transposase [bacterium]|uniref:Transposase IS200 like protein n=1 Tax=candidate division TA06 bacterium ADurb.Bin417 TaxID=1852828 RepID=A0A1V5MI46_UNCT6|nr:MAG: Transposase IS200 like protein [candidate division TA06 bacterium ADurb.Bin417]HNQ35119.1 transposase [bacterium]HNS49322.1 transposase [bacterium]
MARQIRIEFPGAIYHVTARGNEWQAIFRNNLDRQTFLVLLGQISEQYGVKVRAYCLMPNHYHLILETPRGNLSQAVGWLQLTYTVRFNRQHKRSGHLFQGRFKAFLVDADEYAQVLTLYVHLNPVRPEDKNAAIPAGRIKTLGNYRWSSHLAYAGKVGKPDWLDISWLQYWGETEDRARKEYQEAIRGLFGKVIVNPQGNVQDSLVLGGDALREQVENAIKNKSGKEEKHWIIEKSHLDIRRQLEAILKEELDQGVRLWARVRLGGERMIDLSREFGYKDGSGVLHAVKRIERRAEKDQGIQRKLLDLKSRLLSSFKS